MIPEVQQVEQIESVTETFVSVTDSEAFYQALSKFYDEKLPLIQVAVDERITEVMSFFISGYFVLIGLIVGTALWITLKDSK